MTIFADWAAETVRRDLDAKGAEAVLVGRRHVD